MMKSDLADVIDLTNDDSDCEAPPAKINARGLECRSILNDLQPCSSRGLVATPWFPKKNLKTDTKICDFCALCNSNLYLTPKPSCGHSSCYNCFRTHILNQTSIQPKCVVDICEACLDDNFIKSVLGLDDYVIFLEHQREILRTALSPKKCEEISNNVSGKKTLVSELDMIQKFDDQSFNANFFEFNCPICMERVAANDGVILKNCCHSFCKVCISETIRHCEDQFVLCPHRYDDGKACDSLLQEREIRALVNEEIYDQHLKKGLQQAESTMSDVFHCKTPDCDGFIIYSNDTKAFPCQICEKVNCIQCQAIHETKTCEQHKEDLKNDEKNQNELKLTEEAVADMLQKRQAILCANCGSVIQKILGENFCILNFSWWL